jgi:hypothetical protein
MVMLGKLWFAPAGAGRSLDIELEGGKEQPMAVDTLWRIAMQLLRPAKPVGVHFELMSNEDVDQWLETRRHA